MSKIKKIVARREAKRKASGQGYGNLPTLPRSIVRVCLCGQHVKFTKHTGGALTPHWTAVCPYCNSALWVSQRWEAGSREWRDTSGQGLASFGKNGLNGV